MEILKFWWQLIIVIITITGCILIILKLNPRGKLNIGDWFKLTGKSDTDISNALEMMITLTEKKSELIYNEETFSYMEFVDLTIQNVKDKILLFYFEEIKRKECIYEHIDIKGTHKYQDYEMKLDNFLEKKVKPIIKVSCKNNNFYKYSELEFKNYVESHSTEIYSHLVNFMKTNYDFNQESSLKIEMKFDIDPTSDIKIINETLKMFEDMYYYLRSLSLKYNKMETDLVNKTTELKKTILKLYK